VILVKFPLRRITGWGIYVVSLLLFTELSLSAFWTFYGRDRIQYHEYVNLPEAIKHTEFSVFDHKRYDFDPLLGWTNRPGENIDADTARISSYRPDEQIIHAYGDSFVFGAEVEADQSFPHYLSKLTNTEVRNFGVGGYGPDQAILLLERNLSAGISAPVIVLAMPSENIARTVSMFWKLYVPITQPFQIKPLFVFEENQWRLVDAVPDNRTDKGQYLEAIQAAKKYDFWYSHNQTRPGFTFPYIWTTISTIRYLVRDVVRWQDLYSDDRATKTLAYILERFVALSRQYGFKPVFTIIPMPEDLMLRDLGKPGYYSAFLNTARQRFDGELLIIEGISKEAISENFNIKPYSGHASAYGNEIIANVIHKTLLKSGVVPSPGITGGTSSR
jgi:hypothetical protein